MVLARLKAQERNSARLRSAWQSNAHIQAVEEVGIIGRLFEGCLTLFSSLLENVPQSRTISKKDEKRLRRCYETLRLWGDGHEVIDGKLDHVLSRSRSLQHTTLATANALCMVLSSRLCRIILPYAHQTRLALLKHSNIHILCEQTNWILAGSDETVDDRDVESSSDDCEQRTLDDVLEDIKAYVQCLVDLSSALECPALDPDVEIDTTCGQRLVERSAHDFYVDLLIEKFPQASADIVNFLGKTNWKLYQRLQLERGDNASPPTGAIDEQGEKSHLATSEFRDAGLGTSAPVQSTYAESAVSIVSSLSGGSRVQIPPVPAEGKVGQPFECIACGKVVKSRNNGEWRRHLFKDRQPYTCFHASCAFIAKPLYDKQLWSAYLELEHGYGPEWTSQQCPLCYEGTGSGKTIFLRHMARHMEDIALVALPRYVDTEVGSESEESDSLSHEFDNIIDTGNAPTESDINETTGTNETGSEVYRPLSNDDEKLNSEDFNQELIQDNLGVDDSESEKLAHSAMNDGSIFTSNYTLLESIQGDGWVEIKKRAAERSLNADKEDGGSESIEETIEERVMRIKARVAELIGSTKIKDATGRNVNESEGAGSGVAFPDVHIDSQETDMLAQGQDIIPWDLESNHNGDTIPGNDHSQPLDHLIKASELQSTFTHSMQPLAAKQRLDGTQDLELGVRDPVSG